MLRHLNIQDILIIPSLDLEFSEGLNVLTGETGAGKSILLDCLGFVLGWRGRASLVRNGADQGEVSAEFEIAADSPIISLLEDAGIVWDGELILRRNCKPDGRKTSFVNDKRCSNELLRVIGAYLLELHGQNDDRGLMDPKTHLDVLDQFAGLSDERAKVGQAWKVMRADQKALVAFENDIEQAKRDQDFLAHAVDEMDQLDPQPGEDAVLDSERRLMQNAEKLREDLDKALMAMGGEGAEQNLSAAARWIADVAAKADSSDLDEILNALNSAMSELARATQLTEDFTISLCFDAQELEVKEERLFALRALARKHGVTSDELPGLHAKMKSQLGSVQDADAQLADLKATLAKSKAEYDRLANALSDKRKAQAADLNAAVEGELAPLKMERVVFQTDIAPTTPGPTGQDAVEFCAATNPGSPVGPLRKIASGGELSRFLLALKVCLSKNDGSATMIFDEIDRGVGGATADAVGRRLKDIGETAQVLVVTHSPQVAAKGATHLCVSKSVENDMTISDVRRLSHDERIEEIARMLAGDVITEEAMGAAKALLNA